MGIAKATVGLAIWSCLIELIQMGLLGRTADVTEPILLLLAGWTLSVLQKYEIPARQEKETPISRPYPLVTGHTELSGRWAIGACLFIPASYYVVVAAASTDNLVELIAGNGSVGSFLLIGLAMTGISFGGTKATLVLIPGVVRRTRAATWVLGSGVLAYLAIYFGTEQVIVKYNQVFSALQFLLSSDRAHLAGPGELAVRYIALWGFLIIAIVMVQYPLWRWAISESPQPGRPTGELRASSAGKQ